MALRFDYMRVAPRVFFFCSNRERVNTRLCRFYELDGVAPTLLLTNGIVSMGLMLT